MSNNVMMYERSYYSCDLKSIIYTKCLSLSEISSIMIRLSDILMVLCECDIVVSNMKSSNVISENNEMKLVDLCLNELRRSKEEMRIDEICYRSPEELSGSESNEKSVIWSLGCILYEMLNKRLPFKEDNDMNKTMNNIMRCKFNNDMSVDDEIMKEILFRMLKVENEDRLSLMELNKEMIKENEILKDSENNIMIIEERKEILFNNDNIIIKLSVTINSKYYLYNAKYKKIRNILIDLYNNKPNERVLSMLLMMKLYREDYYYHVIKNRMKFQLYHKCEGNRECYLDEMIFGIDTDESDKERINIYSRCLCLCEEGLKYSFKVLKLINPTKLLFRYINIPIEQQLLFGSYFYQIPKLQELDLSDCDLSSDFVELFVKLIPYMKLRYLNLSCNPIGPTGFKFLIPYLYLLINNKDNKMILERMNLDDESMILLSEQLYKYPNINKIIIRKNKNIHSEGLKKLYSKISQSKIITEYSY